MKMRTITNGIGGKLERKNEDSRKLNRFEGRHENFSNA